MRGGFWELGFGSLGSWELGFGSLGFGSLGFGSLGFGSLGFGSLGFGSLGFGSLEIRVWYGFSYSSVCAHAEIPLAGSPKRISRLYCHVKPDGLVGASVSMHTPPHIPPQKGFMMQLRKDLHHAWPDHIVMGCYPPVVYPPFAGFPLIGLNEVELSLNNLHKGGNSVGTSN